jgi:hypothetical protein
MQEGLRANPMHEAAKLVRKEELMRLLLCGHMLKECAIHMRLSYWTVRGYAKEPGFLLDLKSKSTEIYARLDAELAANKEDMKEKLERASEEALEMMIELARTSTGVIKLKSCQDLLDRDTRVSRTKRLDSDVAHDFVSPLFLVHAAKVGREIDAGTVDVAPEPPGRLTEGQDKHVA